MLSLAGTRQRTSKSGAFIAPILGRNLKGGLAAVQIVYLDDLSSHPLM